MLRITSDDRSDELRPPTLGGLLRKLRDDRRVSRERLGFAAGVSASYITHLESGAREHPTKQVIEALITFLDRVEPLAEAERRHLFDLAGLHDDTFPSVEELRDGISDDMRDSLVVHEPNPAAYVDTRWNVLVCNDSYAAAYPGLVEDVSILRWFFGNELSKRVMVEWEREASLTVDWLRGLIGQSGDTTWAGDLLEELGEYREFREMWTAGGTTYGRAEPRMLLRDSDSGSEYALDVRLYRVDYGRHPGHVQFFLGIRN